METDITIIGGGIVGLATAYQCKLQFPKLKTVLLEKEAELAFHQTGHNSGVIHSGIYYTPGSLKAENCRLGREAMIAFCQEYDIAHDICGKVIVATQAAEIPRLEKLLQRGQANDVDCRLIGPQELNKLEPHARGLKAVHVPGAGIVNYRQVCDKLKELIEDEDHLIKLNAPVLSIAEQSQSHFNLTTPEHEITTRYLINCSGLQSDRLTRLAGVDPQAKIVPFRGEYYELTPEAHSLCQNLIYPVPDPAFPFLGVHFTRMIDGTVECGPNAVLALAREGYSKTSFNFKDLAETLCYPGFQKLALRHWKMGSGEILRSVSKAAFVKALQKLIPSIEKKHLRPAPAGIRAQAVTPAGDLVDDFLIHESKGMIHLCNAPSPAATASLNIGKTIAQKLANQL